MTHRSTSLSLLIAGLVVMAASANAAITVTNPSNPVIDQTDQNPCLIGDPSCKPGTFSTFTLIGANLASFDLTSPQHTVAQIVSITGGNTFSLGLDLNDTGNAQSIDSLYMFVNGTKSAANSWDGPLSTVALGNNGTGKSDVTFSGFSLAGLQSTDQITFELKMSSLNDGRENLFVIGGVGITAVPEPSTASLLIGSGLLGAGLMLRRRQRR